MSGLASSQLTAAFLAAPILGIVRSEESGASDLIARALVSGGLRAVEISLTSNEALPSFARAVVDFGGHALLGLGTVRTGREADGAIAAGAQFLVTPNLSTDVLDAARQANVPVVCGVLTPTEIQRAIDNGVEWLKIFPAASLGPQYISDLLAPFPEAKLVPTGGLQLTDIDAYRAAGATALGLAGALATRQQVTDRDWAAISSQAAAALATWLGRE